MSLSQSSPPEPAPEPAPEPPVPVPAAPVPAGPQADRSKMVDGHGVPVGRDWARGVAGGYNELIGQLRRLREMPRVIRSGEVAWHSGPQFFNQHLHAPSLNGLGQSLEVHVEDMAPGGRSQKHGHQNEAMIYILEGRGHDVHDGVRQDWQAGDVCVVHNDSVHQHFNDDSEHHVRALVIKSKPVYLFLGLWFQEWIEPSPKTPPPGHEGYRPDGGAAPH